MWRWLLGFLAAFLGALWAYSAYHANQVAKTFPPAGEFVAVGDVRLHYVEDGSGPPVVLLHGAGANLHDWKISLFDEVALNHRVIAFDRPGHGYSGRPAEKGYDPRVQAKLIHEALDKLGVERPVLVGHSWSGAVVLAYALAYPDEVKGLLVLAGLSHPWEHSVSWYYRLAAAPVLGPVFRHTLMAPFGRMRMERAVKDVFAPNPPPADYVDRAAAPLVLRPRAFLNNARDMIHVEKALREMSPNYASLSMPVIIISGTEDKSVDPEDHGEKLNRAVPNSELVLINSVGHMPHHFHQVRITDAIAYLAGRE